ncbi:Mitochondrial pyruvate carrier 2 [Agyrium rufum]|nr:Mitochondrial pyruvate carrier 2 [Agyrium rufum]
MSSRTALRTFRCAQWLRPTQRPRIAQRFQTTEATNPAAVQQNIFQRLWSSPVGVKTVHFWAPVMKWALVIAGISDLSRPAEKLSLTQNAALTATGAIWTRWCFVIKPKNMLLAAVNFFLFCVGVTQVSRILLYQQSVKNGTIKDVVKQDTKEAEKTVEEIAKDPEAAADKAVN